jgi:hypothetical protein
MGEIARVCGVGTVALEEVPADGDLRWVMLIKACQAATASTCKNSRKEVVNTY